MSYAFDHPFDLDIYQPCRFTCFHSTKDKKGAYAICMAGKYIDNKDGGLWFWYTGEGGQDKKRQVSAPCPPHPCLMVHTTIGEPSLGALPPTKWVIHHSNVPPCI